MNITNIKTYIILGFLISIFFGQNKAHAQYHELYFGLGYANAKNTISFRNQSENGYYIALGHDYNFKNGFLINSLISTESYFYNEIILENTPTSEFLYPVINADNSWILSIEEAIGYNINVKRITLKPKIGMGLTQVFQGALLYSGIGLEKTENRKNYWGWLFLLAIEADYKLNENIKIGIESRIKGFHNFNPVSSFWLEEITPRYLELFRAGLHIKYQF